MKEVINQLSDIHRTCTEMNQKLTDVLETINRSYSISEEEFELPEEIFADDPREQQIGRFLIENPDIQIGRRI